MVTQNITLDGTTTVTAFGRTFSWFNHNLQMMNVYADTGAQNNLLNLTFAGAAWAIDSLTVNSATKLNVTITEANDGISRYIESMRVINGDATLNLSSSFIQSLRVGDPGLRSTLHLTLQDGGAGVVRAYDGDDTVTVGNTSIDFLSLGDGDNTVTSVGRLGTIKADGNNVINLENGADTIRLGTGNNSVNVTGDSIDTLYAKGNDTISLFGDARILQLKMDEGVNILSSENGNIESIFAYHAQNTIVLGLGGAEQIFLSGSAAEQNVSSVGWLGSLQVDAHDQVDVQTTTVAVGIGGAGYIQTSKGDDIILTGGGKVNHIDTFDGNDAVTIGIGGAGTIATGIGNDTVNGTKGFIDLIQTEDGNDLVTLGAGGARFVALGAGDDTRSLVAIPASFGLTIDGDEGSDTVNLSRFTQGLTVGLDQGGNFQDFGVSGIGFFLLHEIQNLIGTAKADTLTGSEEANRLTGGLGSDMLSGLDGDDQLVGGKGNDSLTGGAGLDTFLFAAGDGSDRITDFTLGEDHLSIAGTRRLADISFAKVGLNVDVSVGTLHILVEDMTVADMRVAANFLF